MISATHKYYVGIDIGGTKIKSALFRDKKIVGQIIVKTPQNKKEFIKILKIILKKFIKSASKNNQRINGIGIGCAGEINGNKVISSRNILCLKNFDFRIIFPKPLLLKVDNDARYFLEKKMQTMAGNKTKRILAFTIGTGIGRAYAENGKVKKIKKFEYAEKWEKEYQKIYNPKNDAPLAQFLSKKLTPIVKKYKPDIIILAGGAVKRKNFFQKIKKEFIKNGVKVGVKK